MGAQRIDGLCALPYQKVRHTMLHELRLLLGRFNRHGANNWPPDRFAAGGGIDCIVLVALDVGLYVLGGHEPYLMTELLEFARPVVGRCARFHTNETGRKFCEKRQHLRPAQRLAEYNLVAGANPDISRE